MILTLPKIIVLFFKITDKFARFRNITVKTFFLDYRI